MPNNKHNKGEWSELYAFIKLLKEGRIYAADDRVKKIDDIYLPILKLIKDNADGKTIDYYTGDTIKICLDGKTIGMVDKKEFEKNSDLLFSRIFVGAKNKEINGAFEIEEIRPFLKEIFVSRVTALPSEKTDLSMQIHDIQTGYEPIVGFSIKSDVGSPPTLLNSGKNTRVRYELLGINEEKASLINGITKCNSKEYMKDRMEKIIELADDVIFDSFLSETYTDNLIMIDSALPEIYAELILEHFKNMTVYDINSLLDRVIRKNPMNFRRAEMYRYKIKKLLSASALGMTPGKAWDGLDVATGGYIIIKKDGDVLCYHLYNRNFFESYLLNNTRFDRPSTSRYDYFTVYSENSKYYIDFNVQVRFKNIQ